MSYAFSKLAHFMEEENEKSFNEVTAFCKQKFLDDSLNACVISAGEYRNSIGRKAKDLSKVFEVRLISREEVAELEAT